MLPMEEEGAAFVAVQVPLQLHYHTQFLLLNPFLL